VSLLISAQEDLSYFLEAEGEKKKGRKCSPNAKRWPHIPREIQKEKTARNVGGGGGEERERCSQITMVHKKKGGGKEEKREKKKRREEMTGWRPKAYPFTSLRPAIRLGKKKKEKKEIA